MKTLFKLGVVAVVLVLSFVSAVLAQETTGGLQGTVRDPSGALVPKAEVVLKLSLIHISDQLGKRASQCRHRRFRAFPLHTSVLLGIAWPSLHLESRMATRLGICLLYTSRCV